MDNNYLNNTKKTISKLLVKHYITEEAIRELSSRHLTDIVHSYDNEDFKSKVLYAIYVNPFLLCDDDMLKSNHLLSIEVIADILVKRFNEEMSEYQLQLKDGFITRQQYDATLNELKNQYFNNTIIGQRIYRMFETSEQKVIEKKLRMC